MATDFPAPESPVTTMISSFFHLVLALALPVFD